VEQKKHLGLNARLERRAMLRLMAVFCRRKCSCGIERTSHGARFPGRHYNLSN